MILSALLLNGFSQSCMEVFSEIGGFDGRRFSSLRLDLLLVLFFHIHFICLKWYFVYCLCILSFCALDTTILNVTFSQKSKTKTKRDHYCVERSITGPTWIALHVLMDKILFLRMLCLNPLFNCILVAVV